MKLIVYLCYSERIHIVLKVAVVARVLKRQRRAEIQPHHAENRLCINYKMIVENIDIKVTLGCLVYKILHLCRCHFNFTFLHNTTLISLSLPNVGKHPHTRIKILTQTEKNVVSTPVYYTRKIIIVNPKRKLYQVLKFSALFTTDFVHFSPNRKGITPCADAIPFPVSSMKKCCTLNLPLLPSQP